jgi:hypothetical protein
VLGVKSQGLRGSRWTEFIGEGIYDGVVALALTTESLRVRFKG